MGSFAIMRIAFLTAAACGIALAGPDLGKVAFIGDSITQGAGYNVNNTAYPQNGNRTWRWELFKHLVDAEATFDFVGSISTNYTNSTAADDVTNSHYPDWRGIPFDQDHEGHWGWRASQILGTSTGPSSGKRGTGNLTDWLVNYTPDTVVMMIGINDLNDPGQTPASLASNVSAIIGHLQSDNPNARIHLCELLHVGPGHANQTTLNAAVDTYNSIHLPAIAVEMTLPDSTVTIIPMDNGAGWAPAVMTYDDVHPNSLGETHIASQIAASLGVESVWTPVPIENAGFEAPFLSPNTVQCRPTEWTLFGSPNPAAVPKGLTDYSIVNGSPAGASYIIAGPSETGISQVLTETIQAGRRYQLQASLYKASTNAAPGDYAAELRANGTLLATIAVDKELPMFVTGTSSQIGSRLKEFTAVFSADEFPAAIGQPLEIRLIAKNNSRYIGFEDIRVSWKNGTIEPPEKTMDIFVLTGQSNSLGTLGSTDTTLRHTPLGSHPAEQAGGVRFFWDNRSDGTTNGDLALGSSGGWTVAGPQSGGLYPGNDDHWGPEIGFARMLWNAGYRDFGIVKASRGGGGNGFWHKGSADDHMYQHVLATVNAATANLPQGYTNHRIAGLLYVQGESNDSTEASAAGTRFSDLIDNLKADLANSGGMVAAFGEIAGTGTNRDTTRTAQLTLANARTDVGYAESTGLAVHNQDGLSVHYDAESQILLGERLAAEIISMGSFSSQPLPVWQNLHAWFSADNGVMFDTADAVNRWASLHKGDAVRDLTRRVAGQTFRQDVTSGNGSNRKIMRFAGGNDLWSNASSEFGTLTGPRSIAILCRLDGNTDGFLFDGSTGTGKSRAQIRAGQWQVGAASSSDPWSAADSNTTALQARLWQQHVFTFAPNGSGTTVSHWIDGSLAATINDPQSANLGGLMLGSNGGSPFSRLSADIAEVAVYNIALGQNEISALKESWDTRWGKPTGPPLSASVAQTPRGIPRFGRHELLEITIQSPDSITHSIDRIDVTLAPGTRSAIAWIGLATENGTVLSETIPSSSDVITFEPGIALAEGTQVFKVLITPLRHARLGTTLDASVSSINLTGIEAVEIIPADNGMAGELTLAVVPLFTDVRKSGENGIHTFRIPGIVCDTAGVLHAVYDHRYDNSNDLPADVDVGYARSVDGGATWSSSRIILDYDSTLAGSSGNGVGDPCILHDPVTDTLWVAALWSFGNNGYNGSGPGTAPADTGQYVLTSSADGGETWSSPVNVTADVKENTGWNLIFQGPGHGLAMRDGTLVFPSQYRDASGTVRVCSVFSADHGQSWQFGSGVPTASPQTNENTVCELDDGRLLFSMRTPSGSNGQRAWIHYTPGGTSPLRDGTWGNLYRLPAVPDPVCQGSVIQYTSTRRGDPRELILFGNPASSSSRDKFTLRLSADGGASWPVSRQLYAGSAAYSSICILPDRSIGVLLERDNYTKITFIRVEEEWLMNPDLDSDQDGIPDAWETLNGLNPSVSDATSDSDGDGVSNSDEYFAGTDPLDPSSALRVSKIDTASTIFLEWQSVPGRTYFIDESPDLKTWLPAGGLAPITATSGHSTASMAPDGSTQRFFRVRVLP